MVEKSWEEIEGRDWTAIQIKDAQKKHNDGIIENIVMKFDKPETANGFNRWLQFCGEFKITVEDITPADVRLVWYGPNLNNITFMTEKNSQKYINEKTRLILIKDIER